MHRDETVGRLDTSGARIAGEDALNRLRAICLAFPDAAEEAAWGDPTFRVRHKIFATYKVGDRRRSVWCKAPFGAQDILVDADPERYFIPPYVGHRGWVGVRLDVAVDWEQLTEILEEGYRMTAPKRLAALLATGRMPAGALASTE